MCTRWEKKKEARKTGVGKSREEIKVQGRAILKSRKESKNREKEMEELKGKDCKNEGET